MFNYGKAIQRARKNKGWTQEQLASAIQVKRAVISKYENNQVEPSVSRFKDIARVLDIEDWSELATEQAIIGHLKDEIKERLESKREIPNIQEKNEDMSRPTHEETDTPNIALQKYLVFTINHSHLMKLIELIGVRIIFVDTAAGRIKISNGKTEKEVSLSALVNDLEAMHAAQENNLKVMFTSYYGLAFGELED